MNFVSLRELHVFPTGCLDRDRLYSLGSPVQVDNFSLEGLVATPPLKNVSTWTLSPSLRLLGICSGHYSGFKFLPFLLACFDSLPEMFHVAFVGISSSWGYASSSSLRSPRKLASSHNMISQLSSFLTSLSSFSIFHFHLIIFPHFI